MSEEKKQIELLKKIDSYLNGEMPANEQDAFWDLLIENPEYYQKVKLEASLRAVISEDASSDNYVSSTDESGVTEEITADSKVHYLSGYRNWMIAVAAVLVLVIGINLLKVTSPESPATRIALLDDLHIVENIDMFDMESVAATRGDVSDEDDPFTELFDKSLMAAFTDEADEALEVYEDIITRFPDDVRTAKAYMNAGIILYNKSEYDRAADYFTEAVTKSQRPEFEEKAWWFKANAELVLENYEAARYSMYMAYGFNGIYSREAFRQLRILDAYLGYIDYEDIEPEIIDP